MAQAALKEGRRDVDFDTITECKEVEEGSIFIRKALPFADPRAGRKGSGG